MKEHGKLFSAPMALALLRDVDPKTQTRRNITASNSLVDGYGTRSIAHLNFARAWVDKGPSPAGNPGPYLKVPSVDGDTTHRIYSRIRPGDRLWVRETWCTRFDRDHLKASELDPKWDAPVTFRADHPGESSSGCAGGFGRWRPSIFLPRWASRVVLDVLDVHPEKLNSLSAKDALSEGLTEEAGLDVPCYGVPGVFSADFLDPRDAYRELWESINGPGSWSQNPWVWVYTFKRAA